MSASTIEPRQKVRAAPRAGRRAGHTRTTSAALHHTIGAITADAFGIPPRAVTARVHDDRGHLSVTVAVALPMPSLTEAARNPLAVTSSGGTLYERAERARTDILARALAIAGTSVARVDIRLTGLLREKKEATLR
ncbi:hypothetical protein ABIB49_003196 [Arthrobacter sp. UYCu512]